jgi:hypothetical protein
MPRTKVPSFHHTPLQKSPHGTVRHFCKTLEFIKYEEEWDYGKVNEKIAKRIKTSKCI